MDLFSYQLPAWVTIAGILITGSFVLLQAFGKGILRVRKESDDADDRLIGLLQGTVSELDRKVALLEKVNQQMQIDLTKLQTENETMKSILQGRDAATLTFQKAGVESMKRTEAILTIVTDTNRNVEKLVALLEKHFKALEVAVTH